MAHARRARPAPHATRAAQRVRNRSLLLAALKSAAGDDAADWSAERFFDSWFRIHGHAYCILFKKNLDVTNLQYGELLPLLRSHTISTESGRPSLLQFESSKTFRRKLLQLATDFIDASGFRAQAFLRTYLSYLQTVVCVDAYWGSGAVFVPPTLKLDPRAVCAEAGYIYSIGRLVVDTNADRADSYQFIANIARFLDTTPHEPIVDLRVFCHEDYPAEGRADAPEWSNGVERLRIHIEKFFFGKTPLTDALAEVAESERLASRLRVHLLPPAMSDPASGTLPGSSDKPPAGCKNPTLWLFSDRPVASSEGTFRAGRQRHYLLYFQDYRNGNAFHEFDENKPGWLDHTTMPHTLVGAMINLTRPWRRDRPSTLCDPFVGSGTTYIEAAKFGKALSASGFDWSPLSPQVVRDNLLWLSFPPSKLEEAAQRLEALAARCSLSAQEAATGRRGLADENTSQDRMLQMGLLWSDTGSAGQRLSRRLADVSLLDRLVFYVSRRATRRYEGHHRRHRDRRSLTTDWYYIAAREAKLLARQFRSLARCREHQLATPESRSDATVSYYPGRYSTMTTIGTKHLATCARRRGGRLAVRSVTQLQNGRYDLIVTDPPYGFNAANGSDGRIAALYVTWLKALILALRDEGQLILCLPERSYTGKGLPAFLGERQIVSEILGLAGSLGREVRPEAFVLPQPVQLFRPPFYWESEKALRRCILQFRIRRARL